MLPIIFSAAVIFYFFMAGLTSLEAPISGGTSSYLWDLRTGITQVKTGHWSNMMTDISPLQATPSLSTG